MLRALTVLRHNQTQKLSFAQATNATMRIARRRRTRTLEKKEQKEKVQDLLLANKHVIAEEKNLQFRKDYCLHSSGPITAFIVSGMHHPPKPKKQDQLLTSPLGRCPRKKYSSGPTTASLRPSALKNSSSGPPTAFTEKNTSSGPILPSLFAARSARKK